MEIYFEENFEKDLKKYKNIKLLNKIEEIINDIKNLQNLRNIKNLKKLKGYDTFYRIKLGDYRIGLDIIENKVIFTRFLHRKDIYKYFP